MLTISAIALFVLTPLIWQLAIGDPGALLPLVPIAAWLVTSLKWTDTRADVWAVATGAALGLGLYASLSAIVMMPAYLTITVLILLHGRVSSWRQAALCKAAFLVCATPLAISWLRHPEELRQIINSHHLYDADRFNVLQGAREIASWVGLTARSEVYWDYFNPAFLFLTGGVLFPPVLLLLLPLGLFALLRGTPAVPARLWVAALAIAPLAASLTAEPPTPARAIYLTPFAAIVAAAGLQYVVTIVRARR